VSVNTREGIKNINYSTLISTRTNLTHAWKEYQQQLNYCIMHTHLWTWTWTWTCKQTAKNIAKQMMLVATSDT